METEKSVLDRYSDGAKAVQPTLCCPVSYDQSLLKIIPKEIIEKDYGCGDPTPYLKPGDTVLDLGSGGGKICYMAAQIVGETGKVIGVDMNDDMLALAHKYQGEIAETLGFSNVEFRKGKIQDLALNLAHAEEELSKSPIKSARELIEFESRMEAQKKRIPLVEENSIDCIVSNCVLNLVKEEDKGQLFDEMFRVLKKGGRIAISDIVADEPVPQAMKDDPELWSGCISGSLTEMGFVDALKKVGFYGIKVEKRDETPWQTVEGIEFRSVVVTAYKGKEGECWDHNQAVIYKGPYSKVSDDDGHVYLRGEKMAVCKKTFDILKSGPYAGEFYYLEPKESIEQPKAFECNTPSIRSAKVLKGASYDADSDPSPSCC